MNKIPYPQVFNRLSITDKDNPYVCTQLNEIVIKNNSISLIFNASGFIAKERGTTNIITVKKITVVIKKDKISHHCTTIDEAEIPDGVKMILPSHHAKFFIFPLHQLNQVIVSLVQLLANNRTVPNIDSPIHLTANNISVDNVKLINVNTVSYELKDFIDDLEYFNECLKHDSLIKQTQKVVHYYFANNEGENDDE